MIHPERAVAGNTPAHGRLGRPGAVIFDLDGLLIDSEPVHHEADRRLYAGFGRAWTEDLQREFTGRRLVEQTETMRRRWELPASAEELLRRREAIFRELARTELRLMPGARRLLEALRAAGLPTGLGTSAERWFVDEVLRRFGLEGNFGATVSAGEVRRGKPYPDVYLEVARRLGVAPEACWVLEDAPSGVRAAKRAGMACLAIPSQRVDPGELDGRADLLVASLAGAEAVLREALG